MKAIEKIKAVISDCICLTCIKTGVKISETDLNNLANKYTAEFEEILADLQKPKCETCGGSGKVNKTIAHLTDYIGDRIPCPACQKPSGEFTKKVRQMLKFSKVHCGEPSPIECLLEQSCDLLDSKDAEIGILKMGFVPEGHVDIKAKAEQIKQLQTDFDKAKKMLDQYEHKELEVAPLLIKISELQAENE